MSDRTDNMKTLTNERIYQLLPTLSDLIAKDTPISVSIKLRKTLRSVRDVMEDLDSSRQAKVEVHTHTDEKGNVTVDEDAFNADMLLLLKETSDVEIHQIHVTEFPDDFKISTMDLDMLYETYILLD